MSEPPQLHTPWSFAAAEVLDGFDPTGCRQRPELRPLRLGRDSVLVALEGGFHVYRPAQDVQDEDALFVAKNIRAAGYMVVGDRVNALGQHAVCTSCPDLYRCPSCVVVGDETALPPVTEAEVELTADDSVRRWPLAQLASEPDAVKQATREVSGRSHVVRIRGTNPYFVLAYPGEAPPETAGTVATPWAASRVLSDLRDMIVEARSEPEHHPFLGQTFDVSAELADRGSRARAGVLCFNRRCVTLCRYCRLPQQLPEDMPLSTAMKVVDQFSLCNVGSLNLFGGEVSLRPDLEDLVAYSGRCGLAPLLVSTGAGLSPERCERLVALGARRVNISIDAPIAAVHDRMKGKVGLFDMAVAAIRAFVAAGSEVHVNAVMHRDCFRDLPGICDLAAELGARSVSVYHCVSMTSAGVRIPALTRDDLVCMFDEILPGLRVEAREAGVRLSIYPELFLTEDNREEVFSMIESGVFCRIYGTNEPCERVHEAVFVSPYGDVTSCINPTIALDTEAAIGNVFETPLREILGGEADCRFIAGAGNLEGCKHCFQTHHPR